MAAEPRLTEGIHTGDVAPVDQLGGRDRSECSSKTVAGEPDLAILWKGGNHLGIDVVVGVEEALMDLAIGRNLRQNAEVGQPITKTLGTAEGEHGMRITDGYHALGLVLIKEGDVVVAPAGRHDTLDHGAAFVHQLAGRSQRESLRP